MSKRTIGLETLTYVLKLKKELSKRGIQSSPVRFTDKSNSKGCSYGIEFDEKYYYDVISAIKEMELKYKVV